VPAVGGYSLSACEGSKTKERAGDFFLKIGRAWGGGGTERRGRDPSRIGGKEVKREEC